MGLIEKESAKHEEKPSFAEKTRFLWDGGKLWILRESTYLYRRGLSRS